MELKIKIDGFRFCELYNVTLRDDLIITDRMQFLPSYPIIFKDNLEIFVDSNKILDLKNMGEFCFIRDGITSEKLGMNYYKFHIRTCELIEELLGFASRKYIENIRYDFNCQ